MDNIVIFGDVHGRSDILGGLITKAQDKFGKVDFYCTGDLIDRGPDSAGVIQLCIDHNVQAITGNHESWLQLLVVEKVFEPYVLNPMMGARATMESYGVADDEPMRMAADLLAAMPESHKQFISGLPIYRHLNAKGQVCSFWLTHAGVQKHLGELSKTRSDTEMMQVIASKHSDDILWSFPNLGGLVKRGEVADSLHHFRQAIQVFGHKPIHYPMVKPHFIALDTGCGKGNPSTLSAVVLPTMEIIQETK